MIPAGDRISASYVDQQKALHARPQGYGGKGYEWAPAVVELVKQVGASSVLDYGCGQGSLVTALRSRLFGVRLSEYDPAIDGKDGLPTFADLVVSCDVLEHIEPDKLDAVLAHLKQLARKAVFVVIALRPSNKTLPDGRNAHLILESSEWWEAKLTAAGFGITSSLPTDRDGEWSWVLTP